VKYRSTIAAVAMVGALLALSLAGLARADRVVVAPEARAPGSDPAHNSPLEVLASSVASQIAGRHVRVVCATEREWRVFGLPGRTGFVPTTNLRRRRGRWLDSARVAYLAPTTCSHLFEFAKANVKPTNCSATTMTVKTVRVPYQTTVRDVVKKTIRRNGRLVTTRQTKHRLVTRYRRETNVIEEQPIGLLPCYSSPTAGIVLQEPAVGRAEYEWHVLSLQVLAHESIHLYDATAGRPVIRNRWVNRWVTESRAECLGMQRLRDVAIRLGADEASAAQIAAYYWTTMYPREQENDPFYWSDECRADGSLDRTPGDGIFP
jgi:hypothetical protein